MYRILRIILIYAIFNGLAIVRCPDIATAPDGERQEIDNEIPVTVDPDKVTNGIYTLTIRLGGGFY